MERRYALIGHIHGLLADGINLGQGARVFRDTVQSGDKTKLRFRSLVAGENVTIEEAAENITISSTGGGGGPCECPPTVIGGGGGRPATELVSTFPQRCSSTSTTLTLPDDMPEAQVGDLAVWVLYAQTNTVSPSGGGSIFVLPTGWQWYAYNIASWSLTSASHYNHAPYVAYKFLTAEDLVTTHTATKDSTATYIYQICSHGFAIRNASTTFPFGPIARRVAANVGGNTKSLFIPPVGVFGKHHLVTIVATIKSGTSPSLGHTGRVGPTPDVTLEGRITGNGTTQGDFACDTEVWEAAVNQDENWFGGMGQYSQNIMDPADGWTYSGMLRTIGGTYDQHIKIEATGTACRHYAEQTFYLTAGEKYCFYVSGNAVSNNQDVGVCLSYVDPSSNERGASWGDTGDVGTWEYFGVMDPLTDHESVWFARGMGVEVDGVPTSTGGWGSLYFTAQETGNHTIRINSINTTAAPTTTNLTFTESTYNLHEIWLRHACFRSGWHVPYTIYCPNGAVMQGDELSGYNQLASPGGYLTSYHGESNGGNARNPHYAFAINPAWDEYPLARIKDTAAVHGGIDIEYETGLTAKMPTSDPMGDNYRGPIRPDILIYPYKDGALGQYYFEMTCVNAGNNNLYIQPMNYAPYGDGSGDLSTYAYNVSATANDVIGCEIDFVAEEIRWYVNGTLSNTDAFLAETYPTSGRQLASDGQPYYIQTISDQRQYTFNLAGPFLRTPTAGHVAVDYLGSSTVFPGVGNLNNLGSGEPIGVEGPNGEVQFKTVIGGDGITVSSTALELTIEVAKSEVPLVIPTKRIRGAAWSDSTEVDPLLAVPVTVYCPHNGTIKSYTVMGDAVGDCTIDVRKTTLAGLPAGTGNRICGTNKPELTADRYIYDGTLSGWTTAVTAGDVLTFVLENSTTLKLVTVQLEVEEVIP